MLSRSIRIPWIGFLKKKRRERWGEWEREKNVGD
jgi:hypothetical protein